LDSFGRPGRDPLNGVHRRSPVRELDEIDLPRVLDSVLPVIIDEIRVRDWDPKAWPFTVPAVRSLAETGLRLTKPVTFLVGENGSGKSTIVEALAEAFRIDVRGGHGGRLYASPFDRGILASRLQLRPSIANKKKVKSFFLRSETAKGVLEFMSDLGVVGYGDRHNAEVSHGESFLQVLEGRFNERGLYLLDEPEAPLSFRSCLALMSVLDELADAGSQVICATHSPLLTALPGAQILELTQSGIAPRTWRELELTTNWIQFLDAPNAFLRHLVSDPSDTE
jgi:predicted ATPase